MRKTVKDLKPDELNTVSELVRRFESSGGFVSAYVGKAVKILNEMLADSKCVRWLSFVGAIIATGTRGVIADIIGKGYFHNVVTTCGALDHDIARSLGDYYVGDFRTDDVALMEAGLHRVGSVLVPQDNYGIAIERFMRGLLEDIYTSGIREIGTVELCRRIGERLSDGNSFLRNAYKSGANVVVPGIMDGAVGMQIWLFAQKRRDFRLDLFKDYDLLMEAIFKTGRAGALMVGGGISKHHTLWLNQFKGGLDYAVYITTAVEYDGSLSGAPLTEAVSWKKLKPSAKHVTVYGDATLILPIISAALKATKGL